MTAASAAATTAPARIRIAAHAKANLFLRVLAREASGFHSIETLFTLLELNDELVIERIPQGIELEVRGADTGPTEDNLAHRAAALILAETGHRFGVRITLTKRIPVRAGLGGGSSDAAAALHGINALAERPLPRQEILQLAARLGSDVPFLASGVPFAIGWGRGERLFRLPAPPPAPALLVIPRTGVSTTEAYRQLDAGLPQEMRRGPIVLATDGFTTWGGIGRLGGNDFEPVVFGRDPDAKAAFERLAGTGPLTVRLSGSGSAILAVYRSDRSRDAAGQEMAGGGYQLLRTATRIEAAPAPEPQ